MILSLLLPCVCALAPSDDTWPGWRGPGGNGVAAGSPLVRWSEDEGVRWKVVLPGRGDSSPVVWGERVFLTTAIPTGVLAATPAPSGDEPEVERGGGRRGFGGRSRGPAALAEQAFEVVALDRATGAIVWSKTMLVAMPHEGTHPDGTYASPTATTNGELVVASFGSNGIYALTTDGEPLWELDLGDMQVKNAFGEGSSPVLAGDLVLVNWDNEADSFLVALDAKTGKERWRRSRAGGTSWVTPLVLQVDGGPVAVLAGERTIAYDLATGAERWSFGEAPEGGRGGGLIASPVTADGRLYLATGGRRGTFVALDLANAKGDLGADAALWTAAGDTPHVPSPLAYDGILYSLKSNSGVLSAFDGATGERLYGPERMAGLANAYASPVAADGRLYFAGRDGTVEVVAAGPTFESLAVNHLDDAFDASPAVAGDELFLRGREHVYCIAAAPAAK